MYLAVRGLCLGLVELSCPLPQSRASGTSGTVSSAACPWSFSNSLSLSSSPARNLQQITWKLRFCLLEVGIHCTWRLSCCLLEVRHRYVKDLDASHRPGHLCFSWHVWSRCSFLHNFDLFLKLFVITSTRSFQDVRTSSDNSRVELERQTRLVFAVISVRMSVSVCTQRLKFNLAGDRIYPNPFFPNLVGVRETSVHIRSFTILLFALTALLRDCSS